MASSLKYNLFEDHREIVSVFTAEQILQIFNVKALGLLSIMIISITIGIGRILECWLFQIRINSKNIIKFLLKEVER